MRSSFRFVIAALAFFVRVVFAAHGHVSDPALLSKLQPGSTTRQQVTGMLGEPWRSARRGAGEVWEYWVTEGGKRVNLSVEFDERGVVRGVEKMRPLGGP